VYFTNRWQATIPTHVPDQHENRGFSPFFVIGTLAAITLATPLNGAKQF
jgi:hypothetical protein